jgi:hypothetical protein
MAGRLPSASIGLLMAVDKLPLHTMVWSLLLPRLVRLRPLPRPRVAENHPLMVPVVELRIHDGECTRSDILLEDTPAISMEAEQDDKSQ